MSNANGRSVLDEAIAAYVAAGWVLDLRLGGRALLISPHGPECVYPESAPDGTLTIRQVQRDPDVPARGG